MNSQRSVQWRLTGFAALATILTSWSLTPTVTEGGWSSRIFAAVAIVAVTGGLSRQFSLPRPLIPVLQAGALLLLLTVTFVSESAGLGLLPGPAAWEQFGELLRQGFTVTWNEAPPVSATEGVHFMLVAGVGVIALAVDALAVTWRHSTLAGLPLFVLYLVPAAVLPDGVPWPLFALAGLGWVLLQLAEGRDRLARWGKLIGTRSEATDGIHAVGGTGRRLGATALAVAIVIPLVLPALEEGVFGSGSGDGEGAGGGGRAPAGNERVVTPNPIVDLKQNLTRGSDIVILTYSTDDPSPEYLRIATLDAFDGTQWTLEVMEAPPDQQAASGLGTPPGLASTVEAQQVTSEFQIGALDTKRLPLPYPVTRVQIEGDWRWDEDTLDVFTADEDGTALGAAYTATSLDVEPTADQLRTVDPPTLEGYSNLPDGVEDVLAPITSQIVGDQPTQYDKALELQNWFRDEFTYTTDPPPGNSTQDIQAFLDRKAGYCEQFAATMAIMARLAGIPSRVQVGFTPGSPIGNGEWEVTAHDAHAWPELWFEGVGWVRFEPTPNGGEVDGNATPAWAPPPATPVTPPGNTKNGNGGGPGKGPTLRKNPPDGGIAPNQVPDDKQINRGGITSSVGDAATGDQGGRTWGPYLLLLVAAMVVLALAPRATRWLDARRRWARAATENDAITAAWADVLAAAADLDLAPRETETTRDLARRLPREGALSQASAARLKDLARALEQARYADRERELVSVGSAAEEVTTRIEAWRTVSDDVSSGLFAAVSPRDRRRAMWWPVSGRQSLMARWSEVSGYAEKLWASLTNGVSRRLHRA